MRIVASIIFCVGVLLASEIKEIQSCNAGNITDCEFVGISYFEGSNGFARDNGKAHLYLEKACMSGKSAYGCSFLGMLYQDGRGVEVDMQTAILFYEKACALKESWACAYIGYLYYEGKDLKQDFQKSFEYSDLSCSLGYADGCLMMGHFFYGTDKSGIPADAKKAKDYFIRACDLGSEMACQRLNIW
ncbi:tetratricopeptide repeat protein [Helicobacter monodelphidis]|uniref:tetratricopeptide repeat protein n=1 Tax=Helicobacter sp. 15-1451 TaxID=2004995 RepID=UPI0015EC30A7|nr:tetratricopeptide repeat protein [Helicobacter sp. 15-1451]